MFDFLNLWNIWSSITILISFAIATVTGKILIPVLAKLKYGQSILKIGPSWHGSKQGTPTMGGISFIISMLLSSLCLPLYYFSSNFININFLENNLMIIKIFAGLLMSLFFGFLGFLDDFIKIKNKTNLGLRAWQKLILQFFIATMYLGLIYTGQVICANKIDTTIDIIFLGKFDLGMFYWPISAIIIVGIVNAVNLTDGIDGLCAIITLISAIGFMLAGRLLFMFGLSILGSALMGACLGFLIWNFYPAKIFMGDTGSLFLGGVICSLGFGIGNMNLLFLLSAVYLIEMFSVIIQVIYFKITKGKRLFKMSPIHHHFEMIGLKETSICFTFSLIAFSFILIAITFLIYGII